MVDTPGSKPPTLVSPKSHHINTMKETFMAITLEIPGVLGAQCQKQGKEQIRVLLIINHSITVDLILELGEVRQVMQLERGRGRFQVRVCKPMPHTSQPLATAPSSTSCSLPHWTILPSGYKAA